MQHSNIPYSLSCQPKFQRYLPFCHSRHESHLYRHSHTNTDDLNSDSIPLKSHHRQHTAVGNSSWIAALDAGCASTLWTQRHCTQTMIFVRGCTLLRGSKIDKGKHKGLGEEKENDITVRKQNNTESGQSPLTHRVKPKKLSMMIKEPGDGSRYLSIKHKSEGVYAHFPLSVPLLCLGCLLSYPFKPTSLSSP